MSTRPGLAGLLEGAREIALDAGSAILEGYNRLPLADVKVALKADRTPVTEADLAAHRLIIRALRELTPSIPVLSEEDPVPYERRADWREFWLVDPLDGTKDFLARNGEFTVNVALVRGGVPVLGVIRVPALDETFRAAEGLGAFIDPSGGGLPQRLPRMRISGAHVMARSRFHDSPLTEEFERLNSVGWSITVGAAVKFCRLAEGAVSLYPRYTGSMEWDIAAGHAILREAGCRIVDLASGSEPVYNKPDLRNGPFLACSGEIAYERLKHPDWSC